MDLSQLLSLAQEAAEKGADAPAPPGGFDIVTLAPIAMMLGIFYLLILRPQQREAAKRQAELQKLKKDDEVVTIGGMIGTIANLSDDGREVTLKVSDNTRVRILRSAVQTIVPGKSEAPKPTA